MSKIKINDVSKLNKLLENYKKVNFDGQSEIRFTFGIDTAGQYCKIKFSGKDSTLEFESDFPNLGFESNKDVVEDFIVSAKDFQLAIGSFYEKATFEITPNKVNLTGERRKYAFPIKKAFPETVHTATELCELEASELLEVSYYHKATSTTNGYMLFSGDTLFSVESSSKQVICCSTLANPLPITVKATLTDKEEDHDSVFCVRTRDFVNLISVVSETCSSNPVVTLNLLSAGARFHTLQVNGESETGNVSATIGLLADKLKGPMVRIVGLLGTYQSTHSLTFETEKLASATRCASIMEESLAEAAIILSNDADSSKCVIRNPEGTYEDEIEVEADGVFSISLRNRQLQNIYPVIKSGHTELKLDKTRKTVKVVDGDNYYMMRCLEDAQLPPFSVEDIKTDENSSVVGESQGSSGDGTSDESSRSVEQSAGAEPATTA